LALPVTAIGPGSTVAPSPGVAMCTEIAVPAGNVASVSADSLLASDSSFIPSAQPTAASAVHAIAASPPPQFLTRVTI
jgi:hypothetical protein